ncbi:MAG: hypothetical protein KA143_14620, partial [Saprospiraceae bacterium]|nr:hypothetical protein [Saprospiraceae bacterium]
QKVEAEMKPLVIHVDKDEYLPLAEKLFLINKANSTYPFLPVIDRSGDRFVKDKEVSEKVNSMTDLDRQVVLEKLSSIDEIGAKPGLFSIVAFIGKWINNLPFLLGYAITKAKVKRIEFFASVLVGTTMFLYLFYLVLVAIVVKALGGSILQAYAFLFVFGFLYLYHYHTLEKIRLQRIKQMAPKMD